MITKYHRAHTIQEAVELLSKPDSYPLGGGTLLSRSSDDLIEVVDLQDLGLEKIHKVGEKLEIGAAATLSALLESTHLQAGLARCIELEMPINLRNSASVAGALVACDGRSSLATAMLALDAKLIFTPGVEPSRLGSYLPLRPKIPSVHPAIAGKLITKIEIPLNIRFAFEYVARTPADRPIVCAALARWPSGRTRLALGGYGPAPALAMDGNEPGGIEASARNAYAQATDAWASAEYRSEIAAVLAQRCQAEIP